MNEEGEAGVIPSERWKELLARIPGFADLPVELLEELAASLREEQYPADRAVVTEGEIGDRLYLIERGCAEVTTAGPTGLALLATLESGDLFGEIALLNTSRRRQATVKALTALVTLSLSAAAFEKALAAFPEARLDLATTAEALLTAKYLKKKSPHTR
jgi:CRP-like cAMP-binding protein